MDNENIFSVGIVTDRRAGQVRVLLPDEGSYTTGWLHVLQHGGEAWTPEINARVLCLFPPVADAEGYVLGEVKGGL